MDVNLTKQTVNEQIGSSLTLLKDLFTYWFENFSFGVDETRSQTDKYRTGRPTFENQFNYQRHEARVTIFLGLTYDNGVSLAEF